jgi:hypothetical protein
MRNLLIVLACGLLAQPAWTQSDPAVTVPGQIDFQSLNQIYGEPRVMINLGGPLMHLISAASANDPQAAAILGDLKGIEVSVYDIGGNIDPALTQMQRAKAALEAAAWQPVVQVREEGENVQMFAQMSENSMEGMAIMVVNAREAVFINIRGAIDPAEVGKVMQHLDLDVE